MAAVTYLVAHNSNGPSTTLVCAKTKVAPLKRVTIPKLELVAALLLAKLMQYVKRTIIIQTKAIYLWTDSHVTLAWLTTHASRWKDFVRNRVIQIQELTADAHCKHIPGTSNPAYSASRTSNQLINHPLWWTGPPCLHNPELWPKQPMQDANHCIPEARPNIALPTDTQQSKQQWHLVHKYSDLNKFLRITSLCFKFIEQARVQESARSYNPITRAEREKQLLSGHAFNRLTAFIDAQGIIRVGGRLQRALLPEETKHPAILPRHSPFTTLVIAHAHLRAIHGGTELTLHYLHQNYWIIGGRDPVKSYVLRYSICTRQRGIRANQLMGQLPLSRVTPSRPFTHTGVDYAGPLTITTWNGRGDKTQKAWISVFVCFATSAVHIKVVSDYMTDGFTAAFQRFAACRGNPNTLCSDRGTTFNSAEKTLKELFLHKSKQQQRIEKLRPMTTSNGSSIPPQHHTWEENGKQWQSLLNSTYGERSEKRL
ncbi:PREDICTED: uncharacterized protein LOC105366308 [Ceratosolen solmsi marchali]|uniref:Uncharacterized protein LOC105366308 n=1 Tax=Ceratosolen solmsi marchali TaxID=326594 RepID=A0AAJ6YRU0_9HYME|nr:PREDICTED: uncharacterized protein LOC105366308 [Ceratosolen solmsi marchali]